MAETAPVDFAALGKAAAQRAWEEHAGRGHEPPRYLDVHLWLAIADQLRAGGVIEQLDRRAHAAIVAGYQCELEQLKLSAQVWPRDGSATPLTRDDRVATLQGISSPTPHKTQR